MEPIYIVIICIVNIVVLICFFVLCANVSNIKKQLNNSAAFTRSSEFWFSEYERHLAYGRKQQALDALQDAIYYKLNEPSFNSRDQNHEFLKTKYGAKVAELGGEFLS